MRSKSAIYDYSRTLYEFLRRSRIHSTDIIVHLHCDRRKVGIHICERSQETVRRGVNVHGVTAKFESASISA